MSKRVTVQHNCVVGLGCAGINVLNTLVRQSIPGMYKSVAIDTESESLDKSLAGIKIRTDDVIINDCSKFLTIMYGLSRVVILVGLGGEFGTRVVPSIAYIANSLGIDTHAVVTIPFNFEGPKRLRRANKAIRYLRKCCNSIKILYNQHILSKVDEETTLKKTFQLSDEMMTKVIKEII